VNTVDFHADESSGATIAHFLNGFHSSSNEAGCACLLSKRQVGQGAIALSQGLGSSDNL